MFGLPRLLPTNTVPGSAFGGDIDNDDNINNGLNPDGNVGLDDLIAFLILFENGDPRGDLANATGHPIPDGGIDVSDLTYMLTQFGSGLSVTAEPVRFGWRSYQWDGRLNLYHVRHRTFDPKLITWLQPDPLGEVDGLNVYAYCGWDPFNKIDPFGLQVGINPGPAPSTGPIGMPYVPMPYAYVPPSPPPQPTTAERALTAIARPIENAVVGALTFAAQTLDFTGEMGTGGWPAAAEGFWNGMVHAGNSVYVVVTGEQVVDGQVTGDPATWYERLEASVESAIAIGTLALGAKKGGAGRTPEATITAAEVLSKTDGRLQYIEATPAVPAIPQAYWADKHAPTQVTPGVRILVDSKPSGRVQGEVYTRVSHYDQYGRLIAQTHYTTHGQPSIHPNPHHHQYNPGTGRGIRAVPLHL
jgi:RHS repeat-associated protein